MSWVDIVLGGIGGAVVAGGIGNYTAFRIDRLRVERADSRQAAEERAVARLVSSELLLAHEQVEKALGEKRWHVWRRLKRDAWDRHAHSLAPSLSPRTFELLARAYDDLREWQDRVDLDLATSPGREGIPLSGHDWDEVEMKEQLEHLRHSLEDGHRELQELLLDRE